MLGWRALGPAFDRLLAESRLLDESQRRMALDVALGHVNQMRRNEGGRWIYSEQVVQPPIIDAETLERARQVIESSQSNHLDHRFVLSVGYDCPPNGFLHLKLPES